MTKALTDYCHSLETQHEAICDTIEEINKSLRNIEFHLSPDTYIELVRTDSRTPRIRTFRDEHTQQKELPAHSKQRIGHGFLLMLKLNPKTRQSEISCIELESLADYLSFVNRATEFIKFEANATLTATTVPELLSLAALPRLLLDYAAEWPDLLAACQYFQQHPQPNQYVRNVPLALLMNEATFTRYHSGGRGDRFNGQELPTLTNAEQPLYYHLLATNARLEQEHLPPQYVTVAVRQSAR